MVNRNGQFHPVIATGIGINIAMLVLAVTYAGNQAASDRLLLEDGVLEWMQFLAFTAIAMLLAYVATERWARTAKLTLDVLGIAGLSALVAVAALEEISWFQRILAVETPEFFQQHNRQSETNLHNLALGSGSLHKTVLLKLIFIVGILHNLVLPLLARTRPAIRQKIESLGMYLPPLSASIPYLVLVLLSHVVTDHPRKGELGEAFGAVHYLATVFTAYFVGLQYGKPPVLENGSDSRRVSVLFSMFLVFLLFVAWLLSATLLQHVKP